MSTAADGAAVVSGAADAVSVVSGPAATGSTVVTPGTETPVVAGNVAGVALSFVGAAHPAPKERTAMRNATAFSSVRLLLTCDGVAVTIEVVSVAGLAAQDRRRAGSLRLAAVRVPHHDNRQPDLGALRAGRTIGADGQALPSLAGQA